MVYLYAIAEAPPGELGVSGLEGTSLRVVTVDGLSAVVSDLAGDRLEGSEAELWAHETVVERVMAQGPVLPMRFGSTLPDDAAVRALLTGSATALAAGLRRVRGAVEVGVRATWDTDDTDGATAIREPAASGEQGSGTAYLMGRLDRDRRAKALADRIDGPLEALARATERRALPSRGALLRSAYLVDHERLDAFRARVEELGEEIGEAQIVCTGPWPPYSFAALEEAS